MPIPNASIYATSLEEVPFNVTAPGTVNPTADVVQMAFLSVPPPTQPAGTAWVTGTWQGTTSPYVALCLVGPGGTITLGTGLWYSWLKISASPEVPVKYAGVLQVS